MKNNLIVRKYRNNDREIVRKIFCETAFMGEPLENFFEDRDFIADFMTAYYTDYEPESCLIIELKDEIVGYLIGTKNKKKMTSTLFIRILPKSFLKAFFKGTFFKKKNLKFLWWNIYSFSAGEFFIKINLENYPALLHINLLKEHRGKGLGTILIKAYLDYLKREKVPGIHLTTHSEKAGKFFEKNSFRLLYKTKRSYYRGILNKDICYYYGMILI